MVVSERYSYAVRELETEHVLRLKAEERLERATTVIAELAVPYEALLIDDASRKWVSRVIWHSIQNAVLAARDFLRETQNGPSPTAHEPAGPQRGNAS